MAIHHQTTSIITRSSGGNAVRSASYYRGASMTDERTGQSWSYSKKAEVVYSELMASKDAPEWVLKLVQSQAFDKHTASELLWNKVEQFEKRKDSQLARTVEFALPKELNLEQNTILAKEYIQNTFCDQGMIADFSIHWMDKNPHVHVMLTMRHLTEDGFGLKNRDWNTRDNLLNQRSQLAVFINKHLEKHGFLERVDHRSFKDQGIDLIPGIHIGPTSHMEDRGIQTRKVAEHNEIKQENYKHIQSNPDVLLKKLSYQKTSFTSSQIIEELSNYAPNNALLSGNNETLFDELTSSKIDELIKSITVKDVVFSERDMAKAVNFDAKGDGVSKDTETFLNVLAKIKASKELIYLGPGDDGRDRYTTHECFKVESKLQDEVDVISQKMNHFVKGKDIKKGIEGFNDLQKEINPDFKLSTEQVSAVNHLLKSGDIAALVGKAGAGKTSVLAPATQIWKDAGFNVKGLALSGVATQNLKKSIGVDCETIAAFTTRLDAGHSNLDRHYVLLVDEASMVGSEDMAKIVSAVKDVKAKLVVIGDDAQLYGVKGGAPFRAISERIGFVELSEVHRQVDAWQRKIKS